MNRFYSYFFLYKFVILNLYLIGLIIAIILDFSNIIGNKTFSYSFILASFFSLSSYWLYFWFYKKIIKKIYLNSKKHLQCQSLNSKQKFKTFLFLFFNLIWTVLGFFLGLLFNLLINVNLFSIIFLFLGTIIARLSNFITIIIFYSKRFEINYFFNSSTKTAPYIDNKS